MVIISHWEIDKVSPDLADKKTWLKHWANHTQNSLNIVAHKRVHMYRIWSG